MGIQSRYPPGIMGKTFFKKIKKYTGHFGK
jgi:hypothetical protein